MTLGESVGIVYIRSADVTIQIHRTRTAAVVDRRVPPVGIVDTPIAEVDVTIRLHMIRAIFVIDVRRARRNP